METLISFSILQYSLYQEMRYKVERILGEEPTNLLEKGFKPPYNNKVSIL